MTSFSLFRAAFPLLAALPLAACAAPSDDPATDDQNQAIGERWWSPVEVGTYDALNASLSITSTLEGQRIAYSAPQVFLAGSVSRDGAGVEVEDDQGGGVLRARPDGKSLAVSVDAPGFLSDVTDLRFVRREPNAVAGRYRVAGREGATIEVLTSTDDALGLRITHFGRTVEMRARRPGWPFKSASSYDMGNDYDGCTVSVTRIGGAFALELLPGLNPSCTLPKGAYSR